MAQTSEPPVSLDSFDKSMLDALVEVMFLAAYADGEFSPEERIRFADAVEGLTENRISGKPFHELVARIEKTVDNENRGARIAELKKRLPTEHARSLALSLAVRLVAADGVIRTTERELLLDLAEGLDIDRDAAADIVKRYGG